MRNAELTGLRALLGFACLRDVGGKDLMFPKGLSPMPLILLCHGLVTWANLVRDKFGKPYRAH